MKKILSIVIFNLSFFISNFCYAQLGTWTWLKGDSVPGQMGNFGVQGVPSPINTPPATYEPCEWTDLNGNFWMFAGPYYADLWKYNPSLNEWTWIKGSGVFLDTGSYGIQGVPSLTNNPGYRGWGVASWVDMQNNLWMFGGGGGKLYCDLWKYDISSNIWTWMKGPSTSAQLGIYGIQGVPSAANNPGCRNECAGTWTDNSGNLWLFGGSTNVGGPDFNDLWRYNISSNEWTWMKGSQLPSQAGIYGTLGIEDSANTPGARYSHCRWKDSNGNFWLFGGTTADYSTGFNDLWKYNPATNNWAWMGGSSTGNAVGVYGIKGISSATNVPGARMETRAAWNINDNLWLFGGMKHSPQFYYYNDLWVYNIPSSEWTWINGDSTSNPIGHWGTMGVSNPSNTPNGRAGSIGWTDNICNLYFFCGFSYQAHMNNDLWKYTIDTNCISNSISYIHEDNEEIEVYPNPSKEELMVLLNGKSNQIIKFTLFNVLGKKMFSSDDYIKNGTLLKKINTNNLAQGIYFLEIIIDGRRVTKKVCKE